MTSSNKSERTPDQQRGFKLAAFSIAYPFFLTLLVADMPGLRKIAYTINANSLLFFIWMGINIIPPLIALLQLPGKSRVARGAIALFYALCMSPVLFLMTFAISCGHNQSCVPFQ